MSALDLARWQFGVTTVYHFLFVPITIGITWLSPPASSSEPKPAPGSRTAQAPG